MALGRNRRRERTVDYWPGFVDALSTLLLAIMFLLTVFVLAQFILSREISGRDEVLIRLNSQGVTVIMIEHIMRAVMKFSQRLAVLVAGRKIADGAPKDVVRHPEVVRAYLGE